MNSTTKGKVPGEPLQSAATNPEDVKTNPQDVVKAIEGLESDRKLTPQQHDVLEGVLQSIARKDPEMVVQFAMRQEYFSGPLPQARELNEYDEETRRMIVGMAAKDQEHTHLMQLTGLNGHINKDRRGQIFGLMVAFAGLATAAYVVQFSAVAASIIAALDLGTLVYAFIAPRSAKKQAPPEPPKPSPQPKKKRK